MKRLGLSNPKTNFFILLFLIFIALIFLFFGYFFFLPSTTPPTTQISENIQGTCNEQLNPPETETETETETEAEAEAEPIIQCPTTASKSMEQINLQLEEEETSYPPVFSVDELESNPQFFTCDGKITKMATIDELKEHLGGYKGGSIFPNTLPIALERDSWFPSELLELILKVEEEEKNKDENWSGFKLGLFIPVRGRCNQVRFLVPYLHHFLQRRKGQYRIFIVEQAYGKQFNKGMLLNVGTILGNFEAMINGLDQFDYYIFHDVDMYPLGDGNAYSYSPTIVHRAHWRLFDEKNPYDDRPEKQKFFQQTDHYYGGIIQFPGSILRDINGWSNAFWGWGFEDGEVVNRLLYVYLRRNATYGYNTEWYRMGEDVGRVWEYPLKYGSSFSKKEEDINFPFGEFMWKSEVIDGIDLMELIMNENGIRKIYPDLFNHQKYFKVEYKKETNCFSWFKVKFLMKEELTRKWGYERAFYLRKKKFREEKNKSARRHVESFGPWEEEFP